MDAVRQAIAELEAAVDSLPEPMDVANQLDSLADQVRDLTSASIDDLGYVVGNLADELNSLACEMRL